MMYRNYLILLLFQSIFMASCSNGSQTQQPVDSQANLPEQDLEKQQPKARKAFQDTIELADSLIVQNMIYMPAGEIVIGSESGAPNEGPPFKTTVSGFYIDKHPVTVAEFREFIEYSHYKTEAERFGNSGVYDISRAEWLLIEGANWEYPLGQDQPKAFDNHPVTQVSWNDAVAYSQWAKKRLPTEIEWEYAARCGQNSTNKYVWGNEPKLDGRYMANTWQGSQYDMQGDDGFVYTSPVGTYDETACGLTDMAGNVWEWCQNTYVLYRGNNRPFTIDTNLKVIRGGSFMFDLAADNSYTVTYRMYNTKETSLFNTGFRCVKDIDSDSLQPVEQ